MGTVGIDVPRLGGCLLCFVERNNTSKKGFLQFKAALAEILAEKI